MFNSFRRVIAALGLASALVAQAQEPYPKRSIRWIVPYLAGTSPDNTVRIVAEAMSETLKQPIVVENKPGAAGNLGAQIAARAAPDGYTWVYSGSPMATSMRMYKQPGFDVMKDFAHIGRIGISELAVVTSPDSGIGTMRELIERARKDQGKMLFASGGIGSPAHMAAELMLGAAGIEGTHVPYKGATDSTNAVIGKQVDFTLAITSVALPQVQRGRLAALAVTSPQRHPRLPDTPTLAEAGVPVVLTSMGGLSVPAGTPQPIVRRIAEALTAALARPDVKTKIEALGGRTAPTTPDEYATALRAEIGMAEKMMAAARLGAQ
jgi:tripartite-type tricarboxylate transporter receptor subunit TctC